MSAIPEKVKDRFWSKVQICGPDDCWNWIGATKDNGYGTFGHLYENLYAHRFSWELKNGKIPNGMFVLHRCDNPACVNPSHLFLGTHTDNMRDKENKGRANHPSGELNGKSKITRSDVLEIRRMHSSGVTQREIGTRFKISGVQAYRIATKKHWRHV